MDEQKYMEFSDIKDRLSGTQQANYQISNITPSVLALFRGHRGGARASRAQSVLHSLTRTLLSVSCAYLLN